MVTDVFNRDELARRYADRHLKTDPGIQTIFYLPAGAPDREIRLVEVNEQIAERQDAPLEPIDFGVEIGGARAHCLLVLDITPAQWEKINRRELEMPEGWLRDGAIPFAR